MGPRFTRRQPEHSGWDGEFDAPRATGYPGIGFKITLGDSEAMFSGWHWGLNQQTKEMALPMWAGLTRPAGSRGRTSRCVREGLLHSPSELGTAFSVLGLSWLTPAARPRLQLADCRSRATASVNPVSQFLTVNPHTRMQSPMDSTAWRIQTNSPGSVIKGLCDTSSLTSVANTFQSCLPYLFIFTNQGVLDFIRLFMKET